MELLQRNEKDQRYGWTMKTKKIKWKLLQRQIKRRIYIRLSEELIAAELEVKDSYCRPEQEVYLADEGIIDDFLNCWTRLNQQRDVMIETSMKEEPSVF